MKGISLCCVSLLWVAGLLPALAQKGGHLSMPRRVFDENSLPEEFEIVFPERLGGGRAKRDLSTKEENDHMNHVTFKLKAFGKEVLMDMDLNNDITPQGFTLRYFEENGKEVVVKEFPSHCQYQGHVRGQEDSVVILDTCDGLRGLIDANEGKMFIEPYEQQAGEGAHKVFRIKDQQETQFECGTSAKKNSRQTRTEPVSSSGDTRRTRRAVDAAFKGHLKKTNRTRYTELMVVVDNSMYKKYGKNMTDIERRILMMVNAVDMIYQKINIRIVLSALEVWTQNDKVAFNKSAGPDLENFNQYKQKSIGETTYDTVQLMRGTMFDDFGGMAFLGEMCTKKSTGVVGWNEWNLLGSWLALAHEMGHNFGFDHDDLKKCKCLTRRGCIMRTFKTRVPGFSDCNLRDLHKIDDSCLYNLPRKVLNSKCGNGIQDKGEECDCGSHEECEAKDSCCNPNSCKLKRSSQCSDRHHSCCRKCQFAVHGTLCRKATSECDLPERCNGISARCPPDDFKRNGAVCSHQAKLLLGNTKGDIHTSVLNPPISTRYVRISPQHWDTNVCMKTELYGCSTDSGKHNSPSPLVSKNKMCIETEESADGNGCPSPDNSPVIYTDMGGDCSYKSMKFTLSKNGVLRHHCSKKRVCPKGGATTMGTPLVVNSGCTKEQAKFVRISIGVKKNGKALKHVQSGLCVHPSGGLAADRIKLVLWGGCNEERLVIDFVAHDCMLPLGMANSGIKDQQITASSQKGGHPAAEARLQSADGWCAGSKDKHQFLQIDLGQNKKLSAIAVQQALPHGRITGYFVYYSNDGQRWVPYTGAVSSVKTNSFCYKGKCTASREMQCQTLWGPGAASATSDCYSHLNREGLGYSTCSPHGNASCPDVTPSGTLTETETETDRDRDTGTETASCPDVDVLCGQIQCIHESITKPVVDYGYSYKVVRLPSGKKCSAAVRKPVGMQGMVKDGTSCADNKMCINQKCTPAGSLQARSCRVTNGQVCAGRGVCSSRGACHCRSGYDSTSRCQTAIRPSDGGWSPWATWSVCSRACGTGVKERHRFCNNPPPAHARGTNPCTGDRFQKVACNSRPCPVAHSCLHLKMLGIERGKPYPDGVYAINPNGKGLVKTYCDMSRDGGGWTLLVTSHTNTWKSGDVRRRNEDRPSLSADFSILYKADDIKDSINVKGDWFNYRIEANERGRWGGIWQAPRSYSFLSTDNKQTNIELVKKFDHWVYEDWGIEKRMPWIFGSKLTTSQNATKDAWGSVIANEKIYYPAPWINAKEQETHPVNIWYWVREQSFKIPRSCLDVQLRGITKDGIYTIKPGRQEFQTHCELSSFGGGWTLLLTSATRAGWSQNNVLSRSLNNPSLLTDFSVLREADKITGSKHFQYRIEADNVNSWGGVWSAPSGSSFISARSGQTSVKLLKRFNKWDADRNNLAKKLPRVTNQGGVFMTASGRSRDNTGVIVTNSPSAIYIKDGKTTPNVLRLWVREGTWRSCNEVKRNPRHSGEPVDDGTYMIRKTSYEYIPVYCDMTSEQGAYTLIVTSAHNGWTKNDVLHKNVLRPSLMNDYSILGLADQIKSLSSGKTFRYKLEANKRGHWGGVWEAPMSYSFVHQDNSQTDVKLVKKFDQWDYNWQNSLEKRMPWLGKRSALLTTSSHSDYSEWGTIISEKKNNHPAAWTDGMVNPGLIWYWLNENDCGQGQSQVNGGLSDWGEWTKCNRLCADGQQMRHRTCTRPRPVCGGAPCNPSDLLPQTRACNQCPKSPIRSYGGFCLQPETASCVVQDNTKLVYHKAALCTLDYMLFTYNSEGTLKHKCTGMFVCPKGGRANWGISLVLTRQCDADNAKFTRTPKKSLNHTQSGLCVHPNNGWPSEGNHVVFWQGCDEDRLSLDLYQLQD